MDRVNFLNYRILRFYHSYASAVEAVTKYTHIYYYTYMLDQHVQKVTQHHRITMPSSD